MKRTRLILSVLLLLGLPAAQAQFTCTTNNGAITITGYTGPGGAVTFPASINGWIVTTIGDGNEDFQFANLSSVTIPASVTSIGAFAFNDCPNLTAAYFAGNAPTVGSSLFDSDTKATVYYYAGAKGWSGSFAGRPAARISFDLAITSPRSGQSVSGSNALFTVTGTTTDKTSVTNVEYQCNGGSWTSATPSNSWSNWTASVALNPGANTLRYCA